MLITTLGTVMLPRMAHLYANKQETEFTDYAKKSLLFTSYGTFLFAGLAYAIGGTFIPLFLGEQFSASALVFQILSPIFILIGISNVLGIQMLIPMGKERILSFSVISGALANFSGNLFLIPRFGAVGAAISTLCAEFLVTAIQWGFIRKANPFQGLSREFLCFTAAGFACTFSSFLFRLLPISPWPLIGLSCFSQTLVYVLVLNLSHSETQSQLFVFLVRKRTGSKSETG